MCQGSRKPNIIWEQEGTFGEWGPDRPSEGPVLFAIGLQVEQPGPAVFRSHHVPLGPAMSGPGTAAPSSTWALYQNTTDWVAHETEMISHCSGGRSPRSACQSGQLWALFQGSRTSCCGLGTAGLGSSVTYFL